jgi:hypothetical protein
MTCNSGQKIIGISRNYCNYIAWMESAAISKTMIHHKISFFRNYYNCALREKFLRSNVSWSNVFYFSRSKRFTSFYSRSKLEFFSRTKLFATSVSWLKVLFSVDQKYFKQKMTFDHLSHEFWSTEKKYFRSTDSIKWNSIFQPSLRTTR